MPTALIISRYFPPLSSAGSSIRLVKMMKYASEQGWSFSVLTQDPERPVIPEKRLSEFLLDEIPAGTGITRVGNPFWGQAAIARLGRKVVGDSSLPWGCAVAWEGWKRYRRKKPDLIFVNSPPFTNVAIGMLLSSLFKVPLVLDMKDDWVGSPAYWKKGRLRRAVESRIEALMMRKAAATITVTQHSFEDCLQRYSPRGLGDRFSLIPNGEDLDEYRTLLGRERKKEGQRFRLLTAAAGYRPDYRDLTPLLQALELYVQRRPERRNSIEIEFLGEDPDEKYKTWLAKLLPPFAVRYRGALNRQALVERLWQADMLFLVQPRENYTAISGTLYEYWATGKAPVLLFSEVGASSNLVTGNHIGEHFHFSQVEEASLYIERVIDAFYDDHPIWIERSTVDAYDRREMVEKMVGVWTKVLSRNRSR